MQASHFEVRTTVSERVKDANTGIVSNTAIGSTSFVVPTLAVFGIKDEPIPVLDDKKQPTGEKTYADQNLAWLQSAVVQAVRNVFVGRLLPKSVAFRPGFSAWTSFQEMLESVAPRGAHFALLAEWKGIVSTYVIGLGKSPTWTAVVGALLTDKSKLAVASASNKGVVARQLASIWESLSEEQQTKFSGIVTELTSLASTETVNLSDD